MDEILDAIYTDLAEEFVKEGVVDPDIFQIVAKLADAREYILANADAGLGRTRMILALNIELSKLSAIANQFPQEQIAAAHQKQEEKKNARSRSTTPQAD